LLSNLGVKIYFVSVKSKPSVDQILTVYKALNVYVYNSKWCT